MRKAKGSGFKMRSGNKTSFKMMGGSSPVKNAAQQAADRQAQIAAFNAAGGLSQAQNFNPTTGQFDFSSPGAMSALYNSLGNISVSNMYDPSSQVFLNELNWDGSMDLPNNEVNSENSISSDLQKELTEKLTNGSRVKIALPLIGTFQSGTVSTNAKTHMKMIVKIQKINNSRNVPTTRLI